MEQSSDDAGQPSSSHAHGPASEHSKSQLRAASAGFSRKAVMAGMEHEGHEDRDLHACVKQGFGDRFSLVQIAPRSRT